MFDLGKHLLGFYLLIRMIRQERQCPLRLASEAGQDAVVAAIRPIVLELDLELSVISIFVDKGHVDRQPGVVRFEFLFDVIGKHQVILIG